MTDAMQRAAAKKFAAAWKNRGYEKGETQKFWLELLSGVLGVENAFNYIDFENQVKYEHTNFIDAFIPATKVLIEQKSLGKNLRAPIKQSDGTLLSPFQQAKRYIVDLPSFMHPRWVITCNFEEFNIYDMDKPQGEPEVLFLKDLEKEYYRLLFLVQEGNEHLKKELEVSMAAGNVVGLLYEALSKQYHNPESEEASKSLNLLCVRLVFCFYAEDSGIFGRHDMFHDYLAGFDARHMRNALIELFKVLDTLPEDRDPYLDNELAAFPYINGGLFTDAAIEIPQFTEDIRKLILDNASMDFDWSQISPTIFGALFESTLNPETRHAGGMHYTSIENIHKVIDPLFLNDLEDEFERISGIKEPKKQRAQLYQLQDKLASLTFLDPACGSGNFLTETYLSLRRLENRIIGLLQKGAASLGYEFSPIKVSIHQFYGIEINDYAGNVAKTALWIAESQMMKQTEDIVQADLNVLPLKSYSNIVIGNALRIDWETVVPKDKLNYIMGNPPFLGARIMDSSQKEDLIQVFGPQWKNVGNLDYVCGWYKKAAELMANSSIRSALVSTNSVSQGETVANLWKPLFAQGIQLNFAHRTFRWDNEATDKAHVHCVIIGFSYIDNRSKVIFSDGRPQIAKNINAYLIDADNVFIESRTKPLCPVPDIGIGNKPIDGGFYLFTKEEMEEFVSKEPASQKWFKPWYGSYEFINQTPRYCLWLGDCPPNELLKMRECMKRVTAVRDFRLASKSAGTVKLADKPTRFHVENMPDTNYLLVPKVSSEKRKYVPIGFMKPDVLASDLVFIIPSATLYHLGVLTSNVHMAWMRAVCGRLEMRYRYSKDIVYNNFPWPSPTEEQIARIEKTAQAILDARALYPDCSMADLYNDVVMPSELLAAHQENDRAVMAAYGFGIRNMTETTCVTALMKVYQKITK